MAPENLSSSEFASLQRNDLNRLSFLDYASLPKAGLSFLKFTQGYRSFYQGLEPERQQSVKAGAAMLVSLWAYTAISRKDLTELQENQTLLPFIVLWKNVVIQDDILDLSIAQGREISAKDAFWNNSDLFPKWNPVEQFTLAINLIESNPQLLGENKTYIKKQIASAYSEYVKCEDELIGLAGQPEDNYRIFQLRASSFGLMAKALTAVLNGNDCQTEEGKTIEKSMAWFILAAEIADGEIDIKEDEELTMSMPIAANDFDIREGKPIGKTRNILIRNFLSLTGSKEVSSLFLTLRKLYPLARTTLKQLRKMSKNPIHNIDISTNKEHQEKRPSHFSDTNS